MKCEELRDIYTKEHLVNIREIDQSLTVCGITFKNLHLRKSLIRYKQQMFRHGAKFNKDGKKIVGFKHNIPYCVIGTDKAEISVKQECKDI